MPIKPDFPVRILRDVDHMQERIDDLEDALHRIINWSEAYPLDVFPKPDLKKARDLLEASLITCHVITVIARVALDAD